MENKKKFRLIDIKSLMHQELNTQMIFVKLSPIITNPYNSEYHFSLSSFDHISFVLLHNKINSDFFIVNPEEIKIIDLDDYVLRIDKIEGFEEFYLHKEIENMRKIKETWRDSAFELLKQNKEIAFEFSQYEEQFLIKKNNKYTAHNNIITNESIIRLIIFEDTIKFLIKKEEGFYLKLESKILDIIYNEEGKINRIEAISYWALSKNNLTIYEFETNSEYGGIRRSDRNVLISVFDNENSIWQWSLNKGKFLGFK